MSSSLSNLVDNLAKRIPKTKCEDCSCFLEYQKMTKKSPDLLTDINMLLIVKNRN